MIAANCPHRNAYKAAVHLNNLGVALLEKQRLEDALTTVRDGMALMKSILDTNAVPTEETTLPSELEVAAKLRSAGKRFAASLLTPSDSNASHVGSAGQRLPVKGEAQQPQSIPVRIESTGSRECYEDPALSAATLVYNLALSHSLLSDRMAVNGHSLRDAANSLLLLSERMIKNILQTPGIPQETLERAILLDVMVVNCRLRICWQEDMLVEAQELKHRLRSYAQILEHFFYTSKNFAAPIA